MVYLKIWIRTIFNSSIRRKFREHIEKYFRKTSLYSSILKPLYICLKNSMECSVCTGSEQAHCMCDESLHSDSYVCSREIHQYSKGSRNDIKKRFSLTHIGMYFKRNRSYFCAGRCCTASTKKEAGIRKDSHYQRWRIACRPAVHQKWLNSQYAERETKGFIYVYTTWYPCLKLGLI